MNTLFESLNQNSGALSVLFSAAVTVATVIYAILTWKLVAETRLLREAQTEPRVEITITAQPIEPAIALIRLQIRNIGMGAARRLRFRIRVVNDGEGALAMLNELTSPEFFNKGIEYLGPGQERYSAFTNMAENYESKIDSVFEVTMRYESATGRRFEEVLLIDMSEWKGYEELEPNKPSVDRIANSIEQIQRDFGKISGGFRRLKADVYTQDERDKEIEEFLSDTENGIL